MHPLQQTGATLFAIAAVVSAQSSSSAPSASPSSTSSGILAQKSPTWLPDFSVSGVVQSYPTGAPDTNSTLDKTTLNMTAYPGAWEPATTDHPEIQAVMNSIDWTKVPKAPTAKADKDGGVVFGNYDENKDPYCWWSDTNCVKPKVDYLPEDIYYCPNVGDWGLNYDDGPYNPSDDDKELNAYAEPVLYNFLAQNNNQKATLFYIGSNVATYPAAAKRALNDGHVLCVHTWSHPAMTTQTNIQVVAELYWTLRAIKEATGVTTKCWRPPYGDVDDRVRAIAWQMGLRTVVWDQDSNDWNMPGDGGGNLPWDTVNGYFEDWVAARKNGSDNQHGHITLEHELNNATVKMTEKWLPTLQQTFNVKSIHDCMGISQPYWEQNWVYPANASGNSSTHTNSTTSSSTSPSASANGGNASAAGASSGSSAAESSTSAASTFSISSTTVIAMVIIASAFMS
ncbi:uncharacterized protein BX664DRAFT_365499 [Halteromyces radiatus]|uniref:uncharacterized protein n=1 Tax=Halteromyces radiatus TaxID=101107 RepID=UPI00221E7D87|nr:uncharacterized protein BX664DRAFT_365499 [Halteromyces radiatus]KAI8089483.1 hypothetical protein BX664DRAFT_365499 [Halteromyces radiatus]